MFISWILHHKTHIYKQVTASLDLHVVRPKKCLQQHCFINSCGARDKNSYNKIENNVTNSRWRGAIWNICHQLFINSFSPGRCGSNFYQCIFIFKLNLQIDIMSTSCETALRWVPQNPIDEKSTFVQVMVWCCKATSHYLSQCWPSSMLPRPQ